MSMSKLIPAIALAALLAGCGTPVPNRDPLNETFPSVRGNSLSGDEWRLPADLGDRHAVLLVGYEQDAQFDIDRWLIGLDLYAVRTPLLGDPDHRGLVPGLLSGRIDSGMRAGIPEPIWDAVVTVYDDAGAIRRFTGTEDPNSARVLLLDGDGRVIFFHDQGFSVPALRGLLDALPADQRGPPRLCDCPAAE
ncbi:MAG: hypothetical protein U5K33_09510 [Halofilum sp. (in: g-proteobacteria)]|nr:hypothetical protein [Halofilum sp. (in: g-proteobacteria)]